jgi:hypothetical protein
MFFQNLPYMASRQLLIPRIATVGTSFSPLPCQAWHGYGVTNAHRVEVEVGADGPASAPPSGAAAAAPPAGAHFNNTFVQLQYTFEHKRVKHLNVLLSFCTSIFKDSNNNKHNRTNMCSQFAKSKTNAT